MNPQSIVIAGASGYIGRSLIPKLREKYPDTQITALSRTPRENQDVKVDWKVCDLFSLKSLENAVPERVDVAYYLVHSMSPTAHLDQGSFADYDLILADNFSRILKRRAPVHLIYLGGLIPEEKKLSLHLRSRMEVEQVFAERQLIRTVFRAGLIIGPHGSSFEIMLRLVRRLPLMIGPKWTQTLTTPVDLNTVVEALSESAMRQGLSQTYDLAGCLPLSYMDMMNETAKWLGLKRIFIRFPFLSPRLSRWWVTLITQMPKALVYPLIESLRHPMVARQRHLWKNVPKRSYRELLAQMPKPEREQSRPLPYVPERLRVRSVQRLPLPPHMSAENVKEEYVHWLPQLFWPFMKVWVDGNRVVFSFFLRKWEFLALNLSLERSSSDRQLLYIVGGQLSGHDQKGRLEFREVLGRRFVIAAIHEYQPALPWYLYQFSQAKIHLLVMRAFKWRLKWLCRPKWK